MLVNISRDGVSYVYSQHYSMGVFGLNWSWWLKFSSL